MLNQIINWITPTVEHFRVAGYWIVFIAAMAETVLGVGLLIPGSTIVLLMGAYAARGYLDFGDLIWFAFIGAVLGDNVNYFLGRKYGARWVENGFWLIRKEHFAKARSFFNRHGAVSVLWGRLIPTVKEVVPFIAGLVGMHRGVFLFWNVLGAVCWSFEWVLAGYIFAQSLSLAKIWLSRLGFFLALLIGLFILLALARRAIVKQGRLMLELAQSVARSVGRSVAENPEVIKLVNRHKRLFSFLGHRLARDRFNGLPLTLLGGAFIYLLVLFGGIVEDLLTGDPIVAADMHISSLIAVFRTPELVHFFLWITMLGKSQIVMVFSLALVGMLYLLREKPLIPPFLLVLLGSTTFAWLGKVAFHRPRPALAVYTEHSYSFPSGHSMISVVFYGFVVYLMVSRTQVWKRKVNYIFAGVVVVLMIGSSRVYLGVHYLSDVWSGYLLGSLWLVIGITLSQYRKSLANTDPRGPLPHSRTGVLVLMLTAMAFYTGFTAINLPVVSLPGQMEALSGVVSTPSGVFPDERSRFTENIIGEKQQPMNVVLTAVDDRTLIHSLGLAGWRPTESLSPSSVLKSVSAIVRGKSYEAAPVTPSFRAVKVNDMSFRHRAAAGETGVTHVLRLWRTALKWEDGKIVYVGQVSRARSLAHESTHRINLEVDGERDFLMRSLLKAPIAVTHQSFDLVKPADGHNILGDLFVTDGRAVFVVLKDGQAGPDRDGTGQLPGETDTDSEGRR